MDIVYQNFNFGSIKKRVNTKYIIICDTQTETIDMVQTHNYSITDKGLHGIPYHYIVKRDGTIYCCKPVIYQFELYDSLTNEICIAVEGNANTIDISQAQRDSLITLAGTLIEKECLSYYSVVLLSDLVGGKNPGTITNWISIKDSITNNWVDRDTNRIPIINIDLDTSTGSSNDNIGFTVIGKNTNLGRLANSLGTTPDKISSPDSLKVSKSLKAGLTATSSSVSPSTSVVYQNNIVAQASAIAGSQSTAAQATSDVIASKYSSYGTWFSTQANAVVTAVANSNTIATSNNATNNTIPSWCSNDITLPGYSRSKLVFTDVSSGASVEMKFLVSPSSFTDTRQTQQQISRTTGGLFVMRMGQQTTSLSITGYLLDTSDLKERQAWIVAYNNYIRDTRDSFLQYQNNYTTTLLIEGRTYTGIVQAISLSKSAVQQFLYQYNISFFVLAETSVYNTLDQLYSSTDTTPIDSRAATVAASSVVTGTLATQLYSALTLS